MMQLEMQNMRKNSFASDTSSVNSSLDSLESINESMSSEFLYDEDMETTTCKVLSRMIEGCLRDAKKNVLDCGEMLLPTELTLRIAQDITRMSANEPCGLRGCVLLIHLEDKVLCRKLGRIVCDPGMVPTFEITLALQINMSRWKNLLSFSRFLKNKKLFISEAYTMCKRKLYRSSSMSDDSLAM